MSAIIEQILLSLEVSIWGMELELTTFNSLYENIKNEKMIFIDSDRLA